MSYLVGRNNPVTIRHAVRNLAQTGLVTGQAANIGVVLSTPSVGASAAAIVKAEIGTSGWYSLTFTPEVLGNWIARVTNPAPPNGDGQVAEYGVQVVESATAQTGHVFTNIGAVKRMLGIPDTVTEYDLALADLIAGVTYGLEARIGRYLGVVTWTERYSGDGLPRLWLRQGPIETAALGYLKTVSYGAAGATLTLVDPWRYQVVQTVLDASLRGRPRVEFVDGSVFTIGAMNFEVEYTAGYGSTPSDLFDDATRLVCARHHMAKVEGLQTAAEGESSTSPLTPAQFETMMERVAARYRFQTGLA